MIDKCKKYKFIYVSISFENNSNFLAFLKKGFSGVEIPYIDVHELSPDAKDSLDSYIYIEDTPSFESQYRTLCKKFPRIAFTVLGSVWGREIYKFFGTCKQEIKSNIIPGTYYKIIEGEFKNLVVRVDEVIDEKANVSIKFLTNRKSMEVSLSSLKKSEYGNLDDEYKDLHDRFKCAGIWRALIIDFSDALLRSVINHKNKYTSNGFFVGGILGLYFTFLRLRQMYPEFTFYLVFDKIEELNKIDFKPQEQKAKEFYESLRETVSWAEEFAKNLGFSVLSGFDASKKDLIRSLVSYLSKERFEKILLYSSDTELHPLVSDRLNILVPKETHRGHSQYITKKEILDIWEVNSPEKITWMRAVKGDSTDLEVKGINKFLQENNLQFPQVKLMDYLQILNSSSTLSEFKERMSKHPKFEMFMLQQFDKNYEKIDFGAKIELDPESLKGVYNDVNLLELLKKFNLYKECEMWERNSRIFRSLW